jgi:hypothetical protein
MKVYTGRRGITLAYSAKKKINANPFILNLSTRSSSSVVNFMPWPLTPRKNLQYTTDNRLGKTVRHAEGQFYLTVMYMKWTRAQQACTII